MARSTLLLLLVLGTVAMGAGIGFSQYFRRNAEPPAIAGIYLPEPRLLPDFALADHRGRPFGPAELKGRWTVLAYGYTHCPDICPTTLASLAKAARVLAAQDAEAAQHTAFAFLSVDPGRDTAARLAEYVPFFHPDFLALRGEPAATAGLHRALGIVALIQPPIDPAKPEQYVVDHGIALYVIDPQGRLRAVLRPEDGGAATAAYGPERVAADLLAIEARD